MEGNGPSRHLRGRVVVMLAGALLALTQAFAQPSSRAQVLILGSYHMANPGLDYANLKADDVLAAKRQREIEEVAERLAAFKPTKVAVEVTFGRDGGMNQRYAQYRTGGYSLERGEAEQIGFRVAKRMGHRRVYGIDYRKDLDVARVMAFGAQNGQGDLVGTCAFSPICTASSSRLTTACWSSSAPATGRSCASSFGTRRSCSWSRWERC